MSRNVGRLLEELSVSTEMIAFQQESVFNTKLVEALEEIRALGLDNRFKNNTEYFKNKDVLKQIEIIDKLLLERFGIPIYSINGNGYGIYTTYVSDNSISFNFSRRIEWLEYDKDSSAFARNMYANFTNLRKAIIDNKVTVDREKAYITGLKDITLTYLIQDFYSEFNIYKANAKEVAYVLMHEIGHVFTHIEYSIRYLYTINVLTDNILSDVNKLKDKPLETIKLTYRELDGDITDLENKSNTAIVYYTISKAIQNIRNIHDTHVSSVDSEQLADQFAVRMGYGVYGVTNMSKVNSYYRNYMKTNVDMSNASFIFTNIAACLITTIVAIGAALGVGGIILAGISSVVITSLLSITTSNDVTAIRTYDTDRRRMIRMRNDMVKQLKLTVNNKKALAKLIADLELASDAINSTPEDPVDIIDKLYTTFFTKGRNIKHTQEVLALIEDLMSNELYVKSEKLKLLSGR